jgi:hypothetical protein
VLIVSLDALIIRHYRTGTLQAVSTQMLPEPEGKFYNAQKKKNLHCHVRFADVVDEPVISEGCSLKPN